MIVLDPVFSASPPGDGASPLQRHPVVGVIRLVLNLQDDLKKLNNVMAQWCNASRRFKPRSRIMVGKSVVSNLSK